MNYWIDILQSINKLYHPSHYYSPWFNKGRKNIIVVVKIREIPRQDSNPTSTQKQSSILRIKHNWLASRLKC